ncbi:hypothetical protein J5N97_013335 [Dioscorea zingiberensis]|uniref:Calmodulin n=1 Tax=Dioscorea zingiberensis TaxID=325984 RepID=A0A9D5CQJ5_9LILI|nr:hypothetical protein J5N97_013335 [Dioscorea zingiberensis]
MEAKIQATEAKLETAQIGLIQRDKKINHFEELCSRSHRRVQEADVDENGTIHYIEFITATIHRHKLERDEHLYKAFQYFDKDNNGHAVLAALKRAASSQGYATPSLAKAALARLGQPKDLATSSRKPKWAARTTFSAAMDAAIRLPPPKPSKATAAKRDPILDAATAASI